MVVLLYSTELDQLGKDDADEWAAIVTCYVRMPSSASRFS
jgi:hypothetical protein